MYIYNHGGIGKTPTGALDQSICKQNIKSNEIFENNVSLINKYASSSF